MENVNERAMQRTLSGEDLDLLEALLEEEGVGQGQSGPLLQVVSRSTVPLSFGQQRLWFLHQIDPASPIYNLPTAVRFEGQLNVAALSHTLDEIVRRHESLRTTFALVSGEPVQVIAPESRVPLPVYDLSPRPERELEARTLLSTEARRPFDLGDGPLLRACLLRLGPEEHVVLLVMHHIVSDAWSMGVLIREVVALYEAYAAGQPPALPQLKYQYPDFAVWQRAWLENQVLAKQLDYWRRQLSGLQMLDLPTDRPRPQVQTCSGAVQSFTLSRSLSKRLNEISRREGASLFMTVLAAFNVLLSRYCRQQDIVVGSPIAGRKQAELEGMIGFFVNTLVLRTDLSGDPAFTELLRRVRDVTLDAYANQDVPFEKLIEELQPERALSHTPLFQVVLTFQNVPRSTLSLPGLRLSSAAVDGRAAKFDLTLVVEETTQGLAGVFEYNTDLFDAATMERLAGHFDNLLHGIARNPTQRLSQLPLLSTDEKQQLLTAGRAESRNHARPELLNELFEAQVARTPDAIALTFEAETLSYRALNERAEQLAHQLRCSGVGPDVLVAVLLERSSELVIAILAILKAGGAYLPLDPEYPADRLAFMLVDSAAPVLLTQRQFLQRLPPQRARVLCVDEPGSARDEQFLPQQVRATSDNLAYVIYTSGSTGRPKGVLVTHGNVTRLFAATEAWFAFGAQDVWTLFHSYAFDFSVWELWGALLFGGRLVVVPYLVSRTPAAFYELLVREQVTVLNQTPSAFRQLTGAAETASPIQAELSLRLVIFGGEVLALSTLRGWFARHGDQRPQLVNMYGITETTVHVTYRPIGCADLESGSVIGVPIPDLQLYLLDEHMNPVPLGVSGEMYIGGSGLARGYLGRAELTASRFVPDPFAEAPGSRLYRTGDLARRTSRGELEYLGRCDEQVKIRGFRIELGEIEAALVDHASVKEAVVLARADEAGEKRLLAYVVCAPGDQPTTSELRRHLEAKLPEYMVPAAFVQLDVLPLTPHGKVNRRALPAPEPVRPELAERFAAPRTPVETALVAIWSEVLGLERVGVRDNFFELGGDSIRSVRILGLAKEQGLNFSLQQLFQHQTIEQLAREINNALPLVGDESSAAVTPFSLVDPADRARLPKDLADAYPLTMLQAGMLYHMALVPESSVYHNIDSWHLRARFDAEKFDEATRYVVARHPILRTSFDLTTYSEPLQLVHETAALPIAVSDLRHLTAAEQDEVLDGLVVSERQNHFDLAQAPLIRFHIHRRTDDSFQFSLTECHAIFDGWSLSSTLAEIFGRYFALLKSEPVEAEPPPTATFRDYVASERRAIASAECQKYWDDKLSGSTLLEIPRWPAVAGERAAPRLRQHAVPCTPEMSVRLHDVARALGLPLKNVLMAAHVKVLSLLSGQYDVTTGIVTNGRSEELDGERVRGLFLNSLPLRLDASPCTWAELSRAAFKAEVELLPYRRYPLFALQKRFGGRSLFETVFNYVHFHALEGVLNSGDVEVLSPDTRIVEELDYTFDAAFNVNPLTQYVSLTLYFDAHRLRDEQVEAMAGYYLRALKAIAANPHASHNAEDLLSVQERALVLQVFNNTSWNYGPERCLHEMFEEQAGRTPAAVAVIAEAAQLTYAELDARANQLAHYLRGLGVCREVPVGLCVERSIEMVIALLAILKAGGAYLPLDPQYPQDRLAFMIEDAGVALLLTTRALAAKFPVDALRVLCLDAADAPWTEESPGRVASKSNADNLAYVIYTSGSTGRPKGVEMSHAAIGNRLLWMQAAYPLEPNDRVLQKTALSFDASIWELFVPWLGGAAVVLARPGGQADPKYLVAAIEQHQVTTLQLVPSMLQALMAETGLSPCRALRRLWCGGEALPAELVERCRAQAPWIELHNLYGPTEAAIDATHWICESTVAHVPIGRPLGNVQVYVLDKQMAPAPIGVSGELHIGGAGLARGYLNCPELTAERFVPNSFSGAAGSRLYRTGDLARFLPDGQLEYLGRLDQQVKLRGYRIELGEVEAALTSRPQVREAVVVARQDRADEKRLVAYIVAHESKELALSVSEMRTALRAQLPEYMVPANFVVLDKLPRTSTGKLDRNALPAVENLQPQPVIDYVAPRTEVEQIVAAIWRRVLQVEQVGVNDNFFDLGGHSLLVLRIHKELEQTFQREIRMTELFQHPTVSALASYLSGATAEQPALTQSQQRTETRRRLAPQQRSRRNQRVAE